MPFAFRRKPLDRLVRVACIVLTGAALSSCATGPEGVLAPVAADAQGPAASTVSMLVATSREPSGDPGTLFTGERSAKLTLTEISISIPPDRAPGTVQWPERLPPDPASDFAVLHARNIDREQAHDWLLARGSRHVLLFVHGFNNRYEDAVFRFAQFAHDSGADVVPILFTWPSRASIFGYNYDKESTNFSRTALETALRTLLESRDVDEVTILAHSMGTWLAMESLRQMAIRDGRVLPKIDNVILAAPDLDVDVFARQWAELGPDKPEFTIFVSQDDRALAMSRLISGGVQRVGAINPAAEPYRTQLETVGITAIDLTRIEAGDSLHHGKFAESPEIVQLIGSRLLTGQTLTDSSVSLGEGLGAVIAGTAGAVGRVAVAPITVVGAGPRGTHTADIGEFLETGAAESVP